MTTDSLLQRNGAIGHDGGAMQTIAMTDQTWAHLRAVRDGDHPDVSAETSASAAWAVYHPIAARNGAAFLMAQVGQSLDGRIATTCGDARDISGADGIAHLHRCRALVDAVVVGVGTVNADDPSLTVRAVSGRNPQRVVIDPNGRMDPDAKMLHDGGEKPVIIQADDQPKRAGLTSIGLPRHRDGLNPADIRRALEELGFRSILVEGGARTIEPFLQAGLLDRLHVSVAPLIIGAGPAGISLPPVSRLADAIRPRTDVFHIGSDILFVCEAPHFANA